jgi:hypothetical protein
MLIPKRPKQINEIMPNQMAPPASGAHGTCPACHTLDTPLQRPHMKNHARLFQPGTASRVTAFSFLSNISEDIWPILASFDVVSY